MIQSHALLDEKLPDIETRRLVLHACAGYKAESNAKNNDHNGDNQSARPPANSAAKRPTQIPIGTCRTAEVKIFRHRHGIGQLARLHPVHTTTVSIESELVLVFWPPRW